MKFVYVCHVYIKMSRVQCNFTIILCVSLCYVFHCRGSRAAYREFIYGCNEHSVTLPMRGAKNSFVWCNPPPQFRLEHIFALILSPFIRDRWQMVATGDLPLSSVYHPLVIGCHSRTGTPCVPRTTMPCNNNFELTILCSFNCLWHPITHKQQCRLDQCRWYCADFRPTLDQLRLPSVIMY